jgi:SAM-dependent methyltransferase
MSEGVEKFVGSIPHYYDRGLAPVMFEPYAAATAERVAATPTSAVLETAAGTGVLTRALRDRLAPDVEIVATDLNAPMLDVAKAKFRPHEKVRFETADAQKLPFADASFDAMCCQFGMMFFPDKLASFREARRVLRPGARYLFSTWDAQQANPFTGIVMEAMRRMFPSDPPPFFDTPFGIHAIDPVRAWLHEAGFGRITIEVLPVSAALPNMRAYAEGNALGSPLADQVRARGGDPAGLIDALTEGFQHAFGAAGAMPLRALLFTAYAG